MKNHLTLGQVEAAVLDVAPEAVLHIRGVDEGKDFRYLEAHVGPVVVEECFYPPKSHARYNDGWNRNDALMGNRYRIQIRYRDLDYRMRTSTVTTLEGLKKGLNKAIKAADWVQEKKTERQQSFDARAKLRKIVEINYGICPDLVFEDPETASITLRIDKLPEESYEQFAKRVGKQYRKLVDQNLRYAAKLQ